ncbi:MAG: hypothetical protein KC457_25650, partial [Myxococcales bacterium]|nr:hypothetical protein [Myxococcales bacterium]
FYAGKAAVYSSQNQQLIQRWDMDLYHATHARVPLPFNAYLSLYDDFGFNHNFIVLDHGDSLGLIYRWGNGDHGCWDQHPMSATVLRAGNFTAGDSQELGTLDAMGTVQVFVLDY